MEQGRGFSALIRFRDLSLKCLLEGVEFCYRDNKLQKWNKVWVEGGRKFEQECRSNGAGRFILCSIIIVEAKRFSLVFPKRRGPWGMAHFGGEAMIVKGRSCSKGQESGPFN